MKKKNADFDMKNSEKNLRMNEELQKYFNLEQQKNDLKKQHQKEIYEITDELNRQAYIIFENDMKNYGFKERDIVKPIEVSYVNNDRYFYQILGGRILNKNSTESNPFLNVISKKEMMVMSRLCDERVKWCDLELIGRDPNE